MQNIGTPRIYVDWGSWLKAMGQLELVEDSEDLMVNVTDYQTIYNLIGLNVNVKTLPTTGVNKWHTINMTSGAFGDIDNFPNYCAVLGHNFATVGNRFSIESFDGETQAGMVEVEIINVGTNGLPITYDGFSIMEFSNPTYHEYIRPFFAGYLDGMIPHTQDLKMGAICFGKYFDFPHSPELNAKQSIEMGQLTRHQSVIGGSLSNSMQTKEMWGDLGAWELDSPLDIDDGSKLGIRAGKRVWDLTFSYLKDRDTLPVNAMGGSLSNPDSMDGYT